MPIHRTVQEFDYDFTAEFSPPRGEFAGGEFPSGTKDDTGTVNTFEGIGVIQASRIETRREDRPSQTVWVKIYKP